MFFDSIFFTDSSFYESKESSIAQHLNPSQQFDEKEDTDTFVNTELTAVLSCQTNQPINVNYINEPHLVQKPSTTNSIEDSFYSSIPIASVPSPADHLDNRPLNDSSREPRPIYVLFNILCKERESEMMNNNGINTKFVSNTNDKENRRDASIEKESSQTVKPIGKSNIYDSLDSKMEKKTNSAGLTDNKNRVTDKRSAPIMRMMCREKPKEDATSAATVKKPDKTAPVTTRSSLLSFGKRYFILNYNSTKNRS